MKKTIFTFSAIAIVCSAIFLACSKDDNSITHVGYVQQNGTGTNPDPNHTNTTSGATTATTATTTTSSTTGSTTPTSTTTTHYSIDGTAAANVTNSGLPSSVDPTFIVESLDGNTGATMVQITFAGTTAPATGVYAITTGTPSSGQCNFLVNTTAGISTASSGVVKVTAAASPNNVSTFNNITVTGGGGSHTVTGTILY